MIIGQCLSTIAIFLSISHTWLIIFLSIQFPINLQQRIPKPPQSFLRIHHRRDRRHILRRAHFHLQVIVPSKPLAQFFPIDSSSPGGNDHLGNIQVINAIFPLLILSQKPQMLHRPQVSPKFHQSMIKRIHRTLFHKLQAPLHPRHKQIRRTAALKDLQIMLQPLLIHQIPLHMQDRRLCKCRQCLMKALDHHIRSQIQCRHRKSLMIPEMSPMSLIHNQWNSISVTNFRNFFNIRYNSIISR